jgi:hypothetical protein
MTNETNDGSSQSAPQASYGDGTGESGTPQDSPFPPLDFPGAEGLQGAPRRRLTPAPVGGREDDRGGALGTLGLEIVGNCVVVWECVEQSELFPNVCNRWEPILIAC